MKSILKFVFFAFFVISSETSVRFTNLKCEELRPDFATFEKCILKVVGRDLIALTVDVKLWQVPVNNVTLNISLQKKASGYRPFLYNNTLDFCKFMANRKKISFAKVFLDMIINNSNINHTCPYDHNIIIQNLILDESKFKLLPLPQGEYMIQLKVGAYNDWKADVKIFLAISADL